MKTNVTHGFDYELYILFCKLVPKGKRSQAINKLLEDYVNFFATDDDRQKVKEIQLQYNKLQREAITLIAQRRVLKEKAEEIEKEKGGELKQNELDWISETGVNMVNRSDIYNSVDAFRKVFSRPKFPLLDYKNYIDTFMKNREVNKQNE